MFFIVGMFRGEKNSSTLWVEIGGVLIDSRRLAWANVKW